MITLHLTLKKKWFDLIKSGEKTQEYREIKPYWTKRLENKHFDRIIFKNGYRQDSPIIEAKFLGLSRGTPREGWCDPSDLDKEVYIIHFSL